MSQINVDTVRNRTSTNGGPTFDKGLTVSAGTTAYVYGNLQVDGTETIVNTERLDVADKTVGIASTTSASNSTADGAGIEVYGGSDGNKTVTWVNSTGNWTLGGGGLTADSAIVGSAVTINGSGIKAGIITANSFGAVSATTGSFSGDVDIADKIVHTGDTDTAIRFSAADTIRAETGGTARLEIDSTGRVSLNEVGTYNDADEYLLVKNTGAACNLSIVGGTSNHSSLNMGDTDDFNIQKIKADHTDNSLQLYTNDSTLARIYIDSSGRIGINTDSFNDAREALRVQAPAGQTETFLTIKSPSITGSSQLYFGDTDFNEGRIDYNHSEDSMSFHTVDTERARITKTGGLSLDNGELIERCYINSTAWSTNGDINLDNGMVQYNSSNLAGTNNTLNITSSVGINTQMATGDIISVTCITAVNATSAYVNHITIDHTAVTENWVGGSAPSDGGGSGVDTYAFNIIKTGSATYVVIGNHVKTS